MEVMTEACGYEAKKLSQQGRGINRYDHRENPLLYKAGTRVEQKFNPFLLHLATNLLIFATKLKPS